MKRHFFFILVLVSVSLLVRGCLPVCGFAGSYPCTKSWELNVKEDELISIIEEVKKEHPEICPPANDTQYRSHQEHYWYMVYFYFPDTKEYVHTWTRESYPEEAGYTSFALIGFSQDGKDISYKRINDDYRWPSNAKHINEFKSRILKLVREKIAKRKTKT